jgi:hypothetical protein
MFRCENCGSGYSVQAAATWDSCPRCLAKQQVRAPLNFELGWRRGSSDSAAPEEDSERDLPDPPLPLPVEGRPTLVASG